MQRVSILSFTFPDIKQDIFLNWNWHLNVWRNWEKLRHRWTSLKIKKQLRKWKIPPPKDNMHGTNAAPQNLLCIRKYRFIKFWIPRFHWILFWHKLYHKTLIPYYSWTEHTRAAQHSVSVCVPPFARISSVVAPTIARIYKKQAAELNINY